MASKIKALKPMEQLDFTDLAVIARKDGVISMWSTWKKNLCAFLDPAMWEDGPSVFEAHGFERLSDESWDYSGYGIVVVDFDTKNVLSYNDYTTPSSLFPIADNEVYQDGVDPSLAPLVALSKRPDQWRNVKLKAAPTSLLGSILGSTPKTKSFSAGSILPLDATPADFMSLLSSKRGTIKVPTMGECIFFNGKYLPSKWIQHDDRGKNMPEWLLSQLESLRDRGFPTPAWAGFDGQMTSCEIPCSENVIAQLLKEDGDDEWVNDICAAGRRYIALKESWTKALPTSAPSDDQKKSKKSLKS